MKNTILSLVAITLFPKIVFAAAEIDSTYLDPTYSIVLIIYFIGNIIYTAILYCSIPLLVGKFSKRPWTNKRKKILIICNTISVCLILCAISIVTKSYTVPNLTAATTWSIVASFCFTKLHPESKKSQKIKSLDSKSNNTPPPKSAEIPDPPASNILEGQITLSEIQDKPLLEQTTSPQVELSSSQGKKKNIPLILTSILLLCSLIGNAVQYSNSAEAVHEYKQLKTKYNNQVAFTDHYKVLFEEAHSYTNEYTFYHRYAVIVGEDDYWYHDYSCPKLDLSTYYIFNIETAKYMNYRPCTQCRN